MSIITKGMGPKQMLITQGYGLRKIIEKIIEVIKRVLPKERRKIIRRIPVDGNPAFPIEVPVLIAGNPFETKELLLPTKGNSSSSIEVKSPIIGSPFNPVQEIYKIQGNLSEQIVTSVQLLGTASSTFELKLSCIGEKDFKKMLWEVLETDVEDEDEAKDEVDEILDE